MIDGGVVWEYQHQDIIYMYDIDTLGHSIPGYPL